MPKRNNTGVRGLYKYKGSYWIDLRWKLKNGASHRHSERLPPGTTGGAAKLRAQGVLEAALAGRKFHSDTEPTRLAVALDHYLDWCGVHGSGNVTYKRQHTKKLLAVLGDLPLADVTAQAIERFTGHRKLEGVGPATTNRELVTLKHFLNRCVELGWLTSRPKIALLEEPPPRVRWLTDTERTKLAAELAQPQRVHFRRVVDAALLSGQRLSNVIGLRKVDVDLKNRTISIPKTKSNKRHDVPVSDALAKVLKEALAVSPEKCEHVFVSGRWQKPYTRSGVTAFFRKLCDAAGIKDLHFHDLRHDFATRVRRAGNGLDVVQALLGHASSAMTQRYAHLGRAELHAAVEAADAVAQPLPKRQKRAARKPGKRARSRVAHPDS
jgi:integrase